METTSVSPGQILLDKYRVERVLGQGGMGIVVAARHLALGELFAIKFLLPHALENQQAVDRFEREARASARLKGEHVAKVHDVGRLPTGEPYMVMEHLVGNDLSELLKSQGARAVEESALLVIQACEAISEAHSLGIIHRDLKPANLFLTRRANGTLCIKVLDFGISKLIGDEGADLTQTGAKLGSPLYMSPEQMIRSKDVDARADVWSMGVVLYELITAKRPFLAASLPEVVALILQSDPEAPSKVRPGVPEWVDAIFSRCVEKDPAGRFQSVDELAAALREHVVPTDRLTITGNTGRQLSTSQCEASAPPPSGALSGNLAPTDRNAATASGPVNPLSMAATVPSDASASPPAAGATGTGWGATGTDAGPRRSSGKTGLTAALVAGLVALGGGAVWLVMRPSPKAPAITEPALQAPLASAGSAPSAIATSPVLSASVAAPSAPSKPARSGPITPPTKDQRVIDIDVGGYHACARFADTRVKCWGYNGEGELGLGSFANRGDDLGQMGDNLPFVDLGPIKTATAITAGAYNTCALLNDGSARCWGDNKHGQLGLGNIATRGDKANEMGKNLPAVDLARKAITITAGTYHACALLSGGGVKCWGDNKLGQLGLGDTSARGDEANEMGERLLAVDLGAGKAATAITAGESHTCALLSDGGVKCWGDNKLGQLGLGDAANRGDGPGEMGQGLPAVDLGAGKKATAISAGKSHTCALLSDGGVKCWGDNKLGQLGLGDTASRGDGPNEMGEGLPVVNLGAGKAAAITAGESHTCALLDDGALKCWGFNGDGQLGLGDTANRGDGPNEMGDALPAVNLGTGATVASISAGASHTCARLSDGSVKCWGNNGYGQLSQGSTANRGDGPNEMGDSLYPVMFFATPE